jgi:hypothetical protein
LINGGAATRHALRESYRDDLPPCGYGNQPAARERFCVFRSRRENEGGLPLERAPAFM